MANQKISTTELDFDAIKSNIKTYLQGQSEFSDYNFEGSGLSVLLDILSYNTHYNSLYTNLALNEAFIDSASKRNSVVSRAREIGYTPRSSTGATATIDVVVDASSVIGPPPLLTLPKNSPFTTSVNGAVYTFYVKSDAVASKVNNVYTFSDVTIVEGIPLTFKYSYVENQHYIIPNPKVDISSLKVRVQTNSTSGEYTSYTINTDITRVGPDDAIYFLKEIDNNLFEVEFGNGVVGKPVVPGNVIHFEYMVCNEDLPNGAKTFTYSGSDLLGVTPTVVTVTAAQGGSEPEDIESIRYNAPRSYSAQNRGVTLDDYKTLITSYYADTDSVNVWGGEDNIPPIYGKVFVSIKPKSAPFLTDSERSYIVSEILKPRNAISITPEIVDPTYLDIALDVSVYYDQYKTVKSSSDIKTIVVDVIQDYNDNNLKKFDGVMRYSKLLRIIDDSDSSIVNNITTVKLHRKILPVYDVNAQYEINLVNPVYNSGVPEESVLSNGFYIAGSDREYFIDDLPSGNSDVGQLRLFYYENNEKIVQRNCGTVTYSKGLIVIDSLVITNLSGTEFKLVIKPQSNDVVSVRNQIVEINTDLLSVTVLPAEAAINYNFTSSRN